MFRVRTSGLVGLLGIALLATACSVTTTATVLHKPEAKVTPQEQVALYFAAQALANPSGGGFPSDEWFGLLGACEQPGSGYMGVAWDTHSSSYSGGLGFYNGTWSQYAPQVLTDPPGNAGDAPWYDQVRVARYLYSLYGPSPWGCAPTVGPAF